MTEELHYGERMRQLVKSRDLTQRELSSMLGVSQPTISGYFESEHPSIEIINNICAACGVKSWQFLAGIETNIPPDMFRVLELLYTLPQEKRIIVLRMMNDGIKLALGQDD